MAKSIEEYTAEVRRSSEGSRNALQNQINAIAGNLEQTNKQINENYANQQNTLNTQRNQAARAASIQAAGSGGSFGGAAEIANRKYYEQAFVPAQTQLNTNQSQALENAQAQANSNRLSLESQLAALNDQDARLGLQRYYDELERERQERLAREQMAAASRYLGQGGTTTPGRTVQTWDFGNGYLVANNNGRATYIKNGNQVSAAEFLLGIGNRGKNNWSDMWNNGVSTEGVGWDTVNAFANRGSLRGLANLGGRDYTYLGNIY